MTLEEKREIIIKNKDPALAALESVSDRIYDLTDDLLNKQGKLMTSKIGNYKVEQFALELRNDAEKYEKVRAKLLNSDFNLSISEINYVALAFYFCSEKLHAQITDMEKAASLADDLREKLMSKEN